MDKINAYELLKSRYGGSAATTYDYNRTEHNKPASVAMALTREQVAELGKDYIGGLECTKYRHLDSMPKGTQ